MKIIIILAIISLFIFLLLNLKLKFDFLFDFDKNSHIILKILFFKFKLYPKKKKIDKKQKKCDNVQYEKIKDKKTDVVDKKDKKNDNVLKNLNLLKEFITPLKKYLIRIKRGLFIDDLNFVYSIVKDDAAQTAIFYGRISTVFYPLLAMVSELFTVNIKYIRVYPDFFHDKSHFNSSFKLKVKIYRLLFPTIALLFGVLKNIIFNSLKLNKKIKIKEN